MRNETTGVIGTWLRKGLGAIAVLGLATLPTVAQETVKIGTMSWEDLTPITGITKSVLESAGYTVEVTSFSEWGIAFSALANGDTQIMASQTDYVAQDYWDRFKDRLEKISPVSHGLYQAIAVPSYVTIDSMEQLNESADKFGGKIVGIEPGSGLMREAAQAVNDYGLSLQLVEGSTAAMTAALQSAIERNEWIAVTVWEPSWMVQRFDVKWLADPKGVFSPAQSYYWVGQNGFSAANPHVREEAIRIGDRIAIMKDGAIMQTGTAADIVLKPTDSYVEEFVAGISRLHLVKADSVMHPVDLFRARRPELDLDVLPRAGTDADVDELIRLAVEGQGEAIAVADQGTIVGIVTARSLLQGVRGREQGEAMAL